MLESKLTFFGLFFDEVFQVFAPKVKTRAPPAFNPIALCKQGEVAKLVPSLPRKSFVSSIVSDKGWGVSAVVGL